jgi:hypothetical protein
MVAFIYLFSPELHAVRFLFPTCHDAGPYAVDSVDRCVTSPAPYARPYVLVSQTYRLFIFSQGAKSSHQNRAMASAHVKDVSKVRKPVSCLNQVKK